MGKQQKSKNQLRRERQKLKKLEEQKEEQEKPTVTTTPPTKPDVVPNESSTTRDDIEMSEATSEPTGRLFESDMDRFLSMPQFAQFKRVFDKFHMDESEGQEAPDKGEIIESEGEEAPSDEDNENDEQPQISKKKLRKAKKMPLAELKAKVKNPEIVQWYDVDAADPVLVVEIKSHKNYIPVPAHWQLKREYLGGRRLVEKKAFELPDFIRETGITDMRDTTQEDDTTLKQRQRQKVQPKMNRLDLDYQKLHDAFFKFQKKPKMLPFGEVYFEGKENVQIDFTKYKPGVISEELRFALEIPKGTVLPWVAKMHQLGLPPSYPDIKYPGFNVPIEFENDDTASANGGASMDNVEREPFGQLLVVSDSEEEEEDEEVEEEEEEDMPQYVDDDEEDDPVILEDVLEASQPGPPQEETNEDVNEEEGDIEIDEIEFQSREKETEEVAPRKLYQILKERKAAEGGSMGSGITYDLSAAEPPNKRKSSVDNDAPSKRSKATEKSKAAADDDDDDDDEEGGKFKF